MISKFLWKGRLPLLVFFLFCFVQRFSDMSTHCQTVGTSHAEDSASEIGLMTCLFLLSISSSFFSAFLSTSWRMALEGFFFFPTISFASIPYHSTYQSKIKISQYVVFVLTHWNTIRISICIYFPAEKELPYKKCITSWKKHFIS